MTTTELHISREYQTGIGHIEQRDGRFLVSFYGRRVAQQWTDTLQDARFTLRRLSRVAR